jgi:hypothetical protein
MFEVNLNLNLDYISTQLKEAKKQLDSTTGDSLKIATKSKPSLTKLIKEYTPIKVLDGTKPFK